MTSANFPRPIPSPLGCARYTRDGHGFVGQERVLPRLSPEPFPGA